MSEAPEPCPPLDPCPFCGGEYQTWTHVRDGRTLGCSKCGARFTQYNGPPDNTAEDRLVALWNTRADLAKAAEAAAYERAVETVKATQEHFERMRESSEPFLNSIDREYRHDASMKAAGCAFTLDHIRALIHPDAASALDAVRAEVRRECAEAGRHPQGGPLAMSEFHQAGDPPYDRGPILGVPKDDLDAMRARIETLKAENKALREALESCNRNSQGLSVENFRFHTGLIATVSRAALKE